MAHTAHIARNPGRVRVRRVGTPYAPHFAWILHGFCMNIETCHFDMLVFARFCTVFACGTACFFSHEQLFLHDMWNSLHVFLRDTNSFFCMTRTACTVLHGFLHDMWLNPVPLPLFFSCQAARVRCRSWRTWRSGGGAVPSGHV